LRSFFETQKKTADPPTPTSLRVKLRRVERLRRTGYADGTDEGLAMAMAIASPEKNLRNGGSERCNEKAATLLKCGGFCEQQLSDQSPN